MVSSSDIRPLRALALMAQHQSGLPLNALKVSESGELVVQDPAPPSRFAFRFSGIGFTEILTPRPEGFHFRLHAHLGYVPFTAQDPGLRAALLTILRNVRGNGIAHVLVGQSQSVWVVADFDGQERPTPEAVLLETARLLHAIRPYVEMLRDHLLRHN